MFSSRTKSPSFKPVTVPSTRKRRKNWFLRIALLVLVGSMIFDYQVNKSNSACQAQVKQFEKLWGLHAHCVVNLMGIVGMSYTKALDLAGLAVLVGFGLLLPAMYVQWRRTSLRHGDPGAWEASSSAASQPRSYDQQLDDGHNVPKRPRHRLVAGVVAGVVVVVAVVGVAALIVSTSPSRTHHNNAAATAICTTVNKAATDLYDLNNGMQASTLPYPLASTVRTLVVQGSNYGPPFLSEATTIYADVADGDTATVSSDIGRLAQSCKTITGAP